MDDSTIGRRRFVVKVLAAGGGLVAAAAVPGHTRAAWTCSCGNPWGPLHNYLWSTAVAFWAQHDIITRESSWFPGAYNRSSGASGLCQFIPSTFAWASERFGIYGSPFDPYVSIDLMNALLAEGEWYHWSETSG